MKMWIRSSWPGGLSGGSVVKSLPVSAGDITSLEQLRPSAWSTEPALESPGAAATEPTGCNSCSLRAYCVLLREKPLQQED